ncbi:MAG: hypothetical protein OEV44_06200 [Spirochaetota bacterium]|nr:hypothetical protein [Spirochaetota bacterium]
MKKIYSVLLILLLVGIYANYNLANANVDKEDESLKDELKLTDTEFFQKYVEKYNNANPQFLLSSFINEDDTEIKIYILRTAAKKGFNDAVTNKLFTLALQEGAWDTRVGNYTQMADNWKVRAAAAYLIHEKPDGIEENGKREFSRKLILMMKYDPEERCRGIAVLTLGKLFEKAESKGDPGSGRYDFLNRDTIIDILNARLDKISTSDQFFCWSLVKALGYLKSEKSFYLLFRTRKKGFNQKIKLEISRSVQAIVGDTSSSTPK